MATMKGGYKRLSQPFLIKEINFNNPEELRCIIGSSCRLEVIIEEQGLLDGVMMYFVLNIDDTSATVNTLDEEGLCWEQAVYSFYEPYQVKHEDKISLDLLFSEDYLDITLVEKDNVYLMSKPVYGQPEQTITQSNPCDDSYIIDRRLVARMNDGTYLDTYRNSILQHLQLIQNQNDITMINICFLCSDVSILPTLLKDFKSVMIYLLNPSDAIKHVMEKQISSGAVRCVSTTDMDEFSNENIHFHLVVSEAVNCEGLIKENLIEEMIMLKHFTSSETVYIPSQIHMYGCHVSSDRLVLENRVVDDNIPSQIMISDFINDYRVNIHPDVNGLPLIKDSPSSDHSLMVIDLSTELNEENVEIFRFEENDVITTFNREGVSTGLMFWFKIMVGEDKWISTKPCVHTHWHQACYIFPQSKAVKKGDAMSLKVIRNGSNLHFVN